MKIWGNGSAGRGKGLDTLRVFTRAADEVSKQSEPLAARWTRLDCPGAGGSCEEPEFHAKGDRKPLEK